jgi:hypothetical protein
MCLACTIPVRGRTLGAECLAAVLGPDAPTPPVVVREPGAVARSVARLAFAIAIFATVLPWSRFGAGSEPFGAWTSSPRWSMVAAVASAAGLVLSVSRRLVPALGRAFDVASVVAGVTVATGCLLAVIRPPAFTSPWLGPWVALGAGVLAAAASAVALQGIGQREPAHV